MVLKRITLLFDAAPCVEKPQLGNIFILVTFLCGRHAWEKIFRQLSAGRPLFRISNILNISFIIHINALLLTRVTNLKLNI